MSLTTQQFEDGTDSNEYLDLLLEYEEEFQAKNKIPRNYIYTPVDDDEEEG